VADTGNVSFPAQYPEAISSIWLSSMSAMMKTPTTRPAVSKANNKMMAETMWTSVWTVTINWCSYFIKALRRLVQLRLVNQLLYVTHRNKTCRQSTGDLVENLAFLRIPITIIGKNRDLIFCAGQPKCAGSVLLLLTRNVAARSTPYCLKTAIKTVYRITHA